METSISCPFCDENFSSKDGLKCHLKQMHLNINCDCSLCGGQDENSPCHKDTATLTCNGQCHKQDQPTNVIYVTVYKCDVCDMDFDEGDELKSHKNEEHLNGHFNKHDQSTTNVIYVTVYKCDVCDMDFDEVNDLKSHKTEKHMNSLNYQQDVPISNLKGDIEINMPKNVTKEPKYPYKCQVCDKGFKRVSAKNAHLMRNHQVDDNFRPGVTFKCDICAEQFNLQFKLKQHKLEKHNFLSVVKPRNIDSLVKPKLEISDDEGLTSNTETRGFHGFVKDEEFYEKKGDLTTMFTSVEVEMKDVPNENELFKCDMCYRHFDKLKKLKIHKFKKHFKSWQKSRIPVKIESSTAQYSCEMCHKSFDKMMKLKIHTFKKHIEPNRKIVKMGSTSRIKGSVKLISDRNGFNCGICDKIFKYKRNIKQHQINKHGIVMLIGNMKEKEDKIDPNELLQKLKIRKFKKQRTENKQIKNGKLISDRNGFNCGICDKIFKYKRNIKQHQIKKHGIVRLNGNMKGKAEKEDKIDPNELLQKLKIHKFKEQRPEKKQIKNGILYKCLICKKQFDQMMKLKIHTYRKHLESWQKNRENNSVQEYRENDSGQSVRKNDCGSNENLVIANDSYDTDNQKELHIDTAIKCDICTKEFDTTEEFLDHRFAMHGNKTDIIDSDSNLECDICFKKFEKQGNMRKHKAVKHMISKGVFICDICKKQFDQTRKLKLHMFKKHASLKCDLSYKKFGNQENLNVHMTIQNKISEDSIFSCDMCKKQFDQMKKLKIHKLKMHSNYLQNSSSQSSDTSTNCDKCNKKFPNSKELQMHIFKAHFFAQSLAKKSVKLINDENGYQCEICNKAFKYKKNIKKHQIEIHGSLMLKGEETLYNCGICGNDFTQKGNLKRHQMKAHGCATGTCAYCAAPTKNDLCSSCHDNFKPKLKLLRLSSNHMFPDLNVKKEME